MKHYLNFVGWMLIIMGLASLLYLVFDLPKDIGEFEMWGLVSILSICIGGLLKIISINIEP